MSKKAFLSVLGLALFAGGLNDYNREEKLPNRRVLKKEPVKKIIPKGCKEYFFNKNGYWDHSPRGYVFSCVAMNEKSVVKKFNKWKDKQV